MIVRDEDDEVATTARQTGSQAQAGNKHEVRDRVRACEG